MYDYGARNYDPALGRWMNIDPLAEKYYSMSSYTYVGNMPIIALDPDGKRLRLTGDKENTDQTIKTVNDGLGSKIAKIDKNGNVSLKKLSDKQLSKLTSEQKGLYDVVRGVVDDKNTVNIGVEKGSEDVIIGSYELEKIDIADINAFGEGNAVNQYSALAHELQEQKDKQLDCTPYGDAHKDGFSAEKSITGYQRTGYAPSTNIKDVNGNHIYTGHVDVIYQGAKDVVTATIHLVNNNVVKVERK